MTDSKPTALITGAGRGIGKAIAAKFEDNGYHVLCPSIEEMNLNNWKEVDAFIQEHKHERVDTIINNAGINEINLLKDASDDEITATMNINLLSPIRLLRGFIPSLEKSVIGRIVNIGSIWAVVSKSKRSLYSASKHAMYGVTNTLALELADKGILVNMVCPGFTQTELTKKNNTQEQIQEITQNIPLRRMAKPAEIASLVYFLGSHENTYITGQKISIDGGFTAQ